MQLFRPIDTESAALVGWGVRVLLLSQTGGEGAGRVADRIAGFGGLVEPETDLFQAIETVAGDATGFGLFIMECDGYGGLEAGLRAASLLGRAQETTQIILISRDVQRQEFPSLQGQPILLRAPLSAVSLRVGFEHALRDRTVYLPQVGLAA